MFTNSLNNSDKFRFVGATAKQSNMYDTQPRIGKSAFTISASNRSKNKQVWMQALYIIES